jgi:glyoxylase-like metal-dependent hydrolase (beta-lactamase superfamily II)
MKIEQIYTGCIAQAAYYMESNGEAAIFDPLREVQPYLDKANKDNAKIKYIFETHFHADFVSGHLDLVQKSGGQIVYGPTANPAFEAIIAEDNQEFKVGHYTIKAIHTPGHTLESTCYLLIDKNGKDYGIITGDTLFIGDVGRPDLLDGIMTKEELARAIAHTIANVESRILNIGAQQYDQGTKQKIESKSITQVLDEALEEVDDLLAYISFTRIRVARLRARLSEHDPAN